MKMHSKLMSDSHVDRNAWSLFIDVECMNCNKVQSLVNYKTNGSKCIKCRKEIKL